MNTTPLKGEVPANCVTSRHSPSVWCCDISIVSDTTRPLRRGIVRSELKRPFHPKGLNSTFPKFTPKCRGKPRGRISSLLADKGSFDMLLARGAYRF